VMPYVHWPSARSANRIDAFVQLPVSVVIAFQLARLRLHKPSRT
jgi:hypothetical protein